MEDKKIPILHRLYAKAGGRKMFILYLEILSVFVCISFFSFKIAALMTIELVFLYLILAISNVLSKKYYAEIVKAHNAQPVAKNKEIGFKNDNN